MWDFSSIPVIAETQDFLAVDKPVHLSTIPGGGQDTSLLQLMEQGRGEKLWVVHRLDKEVSGLLVLAKNADTHRELSLVFEHRKVIKTYLALVTGTPAASEGLIDAPIRAYGSGRMGVDRAGGKPSQTRYQVIARKGQHTLLELTPLTGRRHQIRVHCYHEGFPVAGDLTYGNREQQQAYPRLMLHAFSLRFSLPEQDPVHLVCMPPESFKKVLKDYGIRWDQASLDKTL